MTLKKYNQIICATTSPRRKKIISQYFKKPKFIAPSYDEKNFRFFFLPVLLSIYHSFRKLKSIPSPTGIPAAGFDTLVYKGMKIYGKPANKEQARQFLDELSGKTHKVVTGMTIYFKGHYRFAYKISEVTFKNLSEKSPRFQI